MGDGLVRTYDTTVLEWVVDAINRLTAMHGNQTKVREQQMPKPVREIVDAELRRRRAPRREDARSLQEQMAEIDRRMGWS